VLSYLERLDDEFYKSLQLLEPHAPEYVARLKDEVPLVNLMQDTLAFYDTKTDESSQKDMARVASRIVEHVYYREQNLFNKAMNHATSRKQILGEQAAEAQRAAKTAVALAQQEEQDEDAVANVEEDEGTPMPKEALDSRHAANLAVEAAKAATETYATFAVPRMMDLEVEMKALAARIYAHGNERAKTRTLLCAVYHHSLHGRYRMGRDMLLMSHLAESIHQFDVATQILYNRALVRCGICAFESGLLLEAHSALVELAAGVKLKELLAQGVSGGRYNERNPEQEKTERRRLVPYHMHINLELVEAVHLVCAMLLELPNLAHNAFDPKRRAAAVSKTFRRLLDHFERQVFNGPPENIRDHMMCASQQLLSGKWDVAVASLVAMPVWSLLADPERSRTFLRRQLQVEGVRAYLISSYAHYDSMSLPSIASRFGLTAEEAHAIVSKMMLATELHACWDQPTSTVVVQRTEPSKLQFLALQLADKVASFIDTNEYVLDSRTGMFGNKSHDFHERRGGYDGYQRERRPWVERSARYTGSRPWHSHHSDSRGNFGGRGAGDSNVRGVSTFRGAARSSSMYVERRGGFAGRR